MGVVAVARDTWPPWPEPPRRRVSAGYVRPHRRPYRRPTGAPPAFSPARRRADGRE